MYKYEMIIEGAPYQALFVDHIEAADFLDECDAAGEEVIVKGYRLMDVAEAMADPDFTEGYVEEVAALTLKAA